jgi:D-alanyl-D-alanine carboxypeptidase
MCVFLCQLFARAVLRLTLLLIKIIDGFTRCTFSWHGWTRERTINVFAYIGLISFFILFSGYFVYYSSYFRQLANGLYFFNDNQPNFIAATKSKESTATTYTYQFPIVAEDTEKSEKDEKNPAPETSAAAVLVVDVANNRVLFEQNMNKQLAPASTTKLMTAVVATDIYSLGETLAVPPECTVVEGTKSFLPSEKKFKVLDLLYALLVNSSADASCVLANGKVKYSDFLLLMNEKAAQLGMDNTNFTNSIGLDGENGSHHSTAHDLYLLEHYAMENRVIRDIVKTKEFIFTSTDGDFVTTVKSTNQLLWEIPETIGVKTGTTAAAGEVLIYEYAGNDKHFSIIVMGSADRFADTRKLLNWALTF